MTFEQWAWGRGFSLPQMDVAKMAWEAALKAQVGEPCPLCHAREVLVTTEIVGRQIDDLLNPTTERRVIPEDEKLRMALENCRLLAARHRKEDWALLILGFCAEGGVVGSVMR